MADKLKVLRAQPGIVENNPGAGGMIATQQIKAAPADGSTVMLTIDHSHVIVPLSFKAPGCDPLKDFTALAGVASYYNVMAVASSFNVKAAPEIPTFQELGIKGIDKNPWLAFFGPKGMSPEFVERIRRISI